MEHINAASNPSIKRIVQKQVGQQSGDESTLIVFLSNAKTTIKELLFSHVTESLARAKSQGRVLPNFLEEITILAGRIVDLWFILF